MYPTSKYTHEHQSPKHHSHWRCEDQTTEVRKLPVKLLTLPPTCASLTDVFKNTYTFRQSISSKSYAIHQLCFAMLSCFCIFEEEDWDSFRAVTFILERSVAPAGSGRSACLQGSPVLSDGWKRSLTFKITVQIPKLCVYSENIGVFVHPRVAPTQLTRAYNQWVWYLGTSTHSNNTGSQRTGETISHRPVLGKASSPELHIHQALGTWDTGSSWEVEESAAEAPFSARLCAVLEAPVLALAACWAQQRCAALRAGEAATAMLRAVWEGWGCRPAAPLPPPEAAPMAAPHDFPLWCRWHLLN